MAWEQPLFNMSYQAAKDLTSYQFEVVRLTTAAKVSNVTSDGKPFVGILQNKPTSGAEANVMAIGVSTGPLIAGYMYDAMNSYYLAFIIFFALCVIAIPLILVVRHPKPTENLNR